jgi:hypothetical protein
VLVLYVHFLECSFIIVSQPADMFEYELFSIMVHSGGASGGHYYAYIKLVCSEFIFRRRTVLKYWCCIIVALVDIINKFIAPLFLRWRFRDVLHFGACVVLIIAPIVVYYCYC